MNALLKVILENALRVVAWTILFSVVGALIWLSPIGKLIDEFAEFREWKRNQKKS